MVRCAWLEFYALALAMESRFRHLYSGQHEQKKQPNAVPNTTDKGRTSCEMIWNGAQQKPWYTRLSIFSL